MTLDNVEIVRELYDSYASGKFGSAAEHVDPNLVLVLRPEFPDSGVILGAEKVAEWIQSFLKQWERLTMEATEIRAVGDTVIVRVVQRGKGTVSGVEVEDMFVTLVTFRGSKIIRIENFQDEGEALRAVGLDDDL